MEISAKIVQRLILFTLVALIAPMVAFPESFGTQLVKGSLITALYELVFYGFVVFLMQRRGGLLQLLPAAGICLIYRLAMGAIFGLLVAALYGMSIQVSVNLGLQSYLPAILFHILVAPFILKPILDQYYDLTAPARRGRSIRAKSVGSEAGRTSLVVSKERGFVRDQIPERPVVSQEAERIVTKDRADEAEVSSAPISGDMNGFERAVKYIGEHASVHLAAVVDAEGLLMANFKRGEIDPEDWAPLALLFSQSNEMTLARWRFDAPQRISLQTPQHRITVARTSNWYLMVIASQQSDDVLKIRFNQGCDIIRKYVDERFGEQPSDNLENIHVSSAE